MRVDMKHASSDLAECIDRHSSRKLQRIACENETLRMQQHYSVDRASDRHPDARQYTQALWRIWHDRYQQKMQSIKYPPG